MDRRSAREAATRRLCVRVWSSLGLGWLGLVFWSGELGWYSRPSNHWVRMTLGGPPLMGFGSRRRLVVISLGWVFFCFFWSNVQHEQLLVLVAFCGIWSGLYCPELYRLISEMSSENEIHSSVSCYWPIDRTEIGYNFGFSSPSSLARADLLLPPSPSSLFRETLHKSKRCCSSEKTRPGRTHIHDT